MQYKTSTLLSNLSNLLTVDFIFSTFCFYTHFYFVNFVVNMYIMNFNACVFTLFTLSRLHILKCDTSAEPSWSLTDNIPGLNLTPSQLYCALLMITSYSRLVDGNINRTMVMSGSVIGT